MITFSLTELALLFIPTYLIGYWLGWRRGKLAALIMMGEVMREYLRERDLVEDCLTWCEARQQAEREGP